MAHFAKIDSNSQVIDIHVIKNEVMTDENGIEKEELGQKFLTELWGGKSTDYIQTSYNESFRKRYGGIGFFYDKDKDEFVEP